MSEPKSDPEVEEDEDNEPVEPQVQEIGLSMTLFCSSVANTFCVIIVQNI